MVEQVGGTHYQATYQHWDWCAETGLGYLEGNATKYLARHRKKGGKQDLEKALSYVQKRIASDVPVRPAGQRLGRSAEKLACFLVASNLDGTVEGSLIIHLDGWIQEEDLHQIAKDIRELINAAGD